MAKKGQKINKYTKEFKNMVVSEKIQGISYSYLSDNLSNQVQHSFKYSLNNSCGVL